MMMVLACRYPSSPSSPRSLPRPESLNPPKAVHPSLQAQLLMWIVPASSRLENLMALSRLVVMMPAARPKGSELARSITSSSSFHFRMHITGPKISSLAMRMLSSTLTKMVGLMKYPLSPQRSPPVATLAPSFLPSSMQQRVFSYWTLLLRGPWVVLMSSGSPCTIPSANLMAFSKNSSQMDSWTKTREAAMQFCPQLFQTRQAVGTASFMSASGQMIMADLPPSSKFILLRLCLWALLITCLPISVDPVKATLSTSLWVDTSSPVAPSPVTTLSTPGGRPASRIKSQIMRVVQGVCSAGLRTTVHPAARAAPIFQAMRLRGWFQGRMAPTTPTGSLMIMPTQGDIICRVLPLILSAWPAQQLQMYATKGMSQPNVLAMGLPQLRVQKQASISLFLMMSSLAFIRMLPLLTASQLLQTLKASLAALTARSTSSWLPLQALPMISSVAGLTTSKVSWPFDSTYSPLMKCLHSTFLKFCRYFIIIYFK